MKYRIEKTNDIESARVWYDSFFEKETWPGDDQQFWLVRDENAAIIGFCSAIFWPELNVAFLASSAIKKEHRGAHLQRKLIATRVRWARKQGARFVVTYVAVDNYASMRNLFAQGFKAIWLPKRKWHMLWGGLNNGTPMDRDLMIAVKRKVFA